MSSHNAPRIKGDITYDLFIAPVGKDKYLAIYEGETISSGTREPALAACRVLKNRGITGILKVYDAETKALRFVVDIGKGANLTVKGDRFAAYTSEPA